MSFRYSTEEELSEQLTSLLEEDAAKVRLVLKYHNGKKEFTARATDDNMCLNYKTSEKAGIRDNERMLVAAMAKMCELTMDDVEKQKEKLSSTGGKKKKKKAARS